MMKKNYARGGILIKESSQELLKVQYMNKKDEEQLCLQDQNN